MPRLVQRSLITTGGEKKAEQTRFKNPGKKMKEFLMKIPKQQMRSTLAIINTIGVFLLVGALFVKSVPVTNSQIVYMAIGTLLGAYVTLNAYYFGSSKNESDKQKADAESDTESK